MNASLSGHTESIELLAPAGNWDCARAAVENGANAIYFGLDVGFNARARATNFHIDRLPELMSMLHLRGVRGYVTLNTLVFTDELPQLEHHVRSLASAGVDAVLVQDLGVARLIRRLCPDLEIHASTQMTLTCASAISMAEQLGVKRVVLARELSLTEIRQIRTRTSMPLEVFVHGALCVAYSGQCLTSESLGGRSANRGQCAQACRMPYELLCDGERRSLGDVKYLLSPQDLAAYDLVPQLIEIGVRSLKIEGRLKTPEYVANICSHYREAIDAALAGNARRLDAETQREMELSFSRGFTPGWLGGSDHKRLVPGLSSAKRGITIGRVERVQRESIHATLDAPLAIGDGIFLQGDRFAGKEIGGRVYELLRENRKIERADHGAIEIRLQRGTVDPKLIYAGQMIWKTDDPQLTKRLRKTFDGEHAHRRVPIDVHVRVVVGEAISIRVVCDDGIAAEFQHGYCPEVARKHAITEAILQEQFGRLGGSVYQLRQLSAEIAGSPMVPLSILGELRRTLIERLDLARTRHRGKHCSPDAVHQEMLERVRLAWKLPESPPELHVLCRSLEQLRQVVDCGVKKLIADFHDLRQYRSAVEISRAAGAELLLATLRIHKPGEDGLFKALVKHAADGWLARSLAAIDFCRQYKIPFVADFSLNVTNPLTAEQVMQWGARRVTASYDLNRDQLLDMVSHVPPQWLEVVIHQHMPMFHMEHCVFCNTLSPGKNKTDCGRPCDRHDVKLRDQVGVEHVLHADIGCRNTLYNGIAQSGAEAVAQLVSSGIRNFRIELLRDAPSAEIERLIELYRGLLSGQLKGSLVWRELKAHNRIGVTRGTLEQPRNSLAIL